jgi:hypothetical protein
VESADDSRSPERFVAPSYSAAFIVPAPAVVRARILIECAVCDVGVDADARETSATAVCVGVGGCTTIVWARHEPVAHVNVPGFAVAVVCCKCAVATMPPRFVPATPHAFCSRDPNPDGAAVTQVSSSASSPPRPKHAIVRMSFEPPVTDTDGGSGVVEVPVAVVPTCGAWVAGSAAPEIS